ncbi:MAG TPA: UDP-N-acetylmuramate:L-alanyl-gamma-D-glutamyl-meso-diaminopimelate ligase, partial [Patescibacteria group bacterium]|nr:UDP-N-acetylmuramate:L-alanyl-gamma-D-glutamyl-meso-diaminopimelate ligase [Patescibacteria group bacterium]
MHIHILGICGTFMGGLAVLAKEAGHTVTGCDANVYPPMSTQLQAQGIALTEGFGPEQIDLKPDLFVIGNVVSRGNPLMEEILNRGLPYASGPQWIGEHILRNKWVLAVAGTHGKTTTSSMLAWILEDAGYDPGFLIGGVPMNFGISARLAGKADDSNFFVIEADEYDTAFFDKRSKFVHYLPEVAIVNNLEFDHADIFSSLAEIQTAFRRFINLIPRNGQLFGNGDDPNLASLLDVTHCPVKRFGLGENNAVRAFNLRLGPTASEFEIPSAKFHLDLVGELNVRNALAVVAAAKHCGLKNNQIQSAFSTFKGIKRRMEIRGISGGVTVVDD